MANVSTLPERKAEGLRGAQPAGILVVDDIYVQFETPEGPLVAIDHVSLSVRPGEFLAVIGPSGCGKSTLFNVVGGLLGVTRAPSPSPAKPCAGRTPRSAWCSRRSRPFRGAR
jgi:ABC-type nitrate/sulfonate/bicarbonate transport system ATPase subunit